VRDGELAVVVAKLACRAKPSICRSELLAIPSSSGDGWLIGQTVALVYLKTLVVTGAVVVMVWWCRGLSGAGGSGGGGGLYRLLSSSGGGAGGLRWCWWLSTVAQVVVQGGSRYDAGLRSCRGLRRCSTTVPLLHGPVIWTTLAWRARVLLCGHVFSERALT
jgi:hypothetical protein